MRRSSLLVLLFLLGYAGLGLGRDGEVAAIGGGEPAIRDVRLDDFLLADPDYDAKGGGPIFLLDGRDLVLRARVEGVERLIVDVTLSATTTLASYTGRPDAQGNVEIAISLPSTQREHLPYILQLLGVVPLAPGQEWHGLWRGDPAGDLPVVAGTALRVAVAVP
jgi:hypothetical protein